MNLDDYRNINFEQLGKMFFNSIVITEIMGHSKVTSLVDYLTSKNPSVEERFFVDYLKNLK